MAAANVTPPTAGWSATLNLSNAKVAEDSKELRPAAELVDTTAGISKMIDALDGLSTTPPSMYIDLEGENLSRHGNISLLQIFVLPTRSTYLIDVYTLQDRAFLTRGTNGKHLKDILESDIIPKVIFDVRIDSDALYAHFNINLAGIQDLQLMELATRTFSRRCVNGLGKCVERDARMTLMESLAFRSTKEKGLNLFAPERGGSYKVFNVRPLSNEIMQYCCQDVHYLPRLWSYYKARLTPSWEARVLDATRDRITLSKSPNFIGKGRHMALAPSGWA